MGGFDFTFDDNLFSDSWSFGTEEKKKKRKTPKWPILIIIVVIVGFFVLKSGFNPMDFIKSDSTSNGSAGEGGDDGGSSGSDFPVFTEKGYYTDQYIVKLEFLDSVTLNEENYYLLNLVVESEELQNLNILSPTKEVVFYNTEQKKDSYRVTVPVSQELKLKLPFRALTSFSREFIPIVIYSNDEGVYDFFFIKTDVEKNDPLPPRTRSSVSINVDKITPAEIVQDNAILTKFKITASSNTEYVYGVIVEIALSDDSYEFAKSGSNIIMVPTLSGDYTLNLYIVKNTGAFMSGERIKAVVTLKTPDGGLIQKRTTIIVKE